MLSPQAAKIHSSRSGLEEWKLLVSAEQKWKFEIDLP
jgi:hypothetical protein